MAKVLTYQATSLSSIIQLSTIINPTSDRQLNAGTSRELLPDFPLPSDGYGKNWPILGVRYKVFRSKRMLANIWSPVAGVFPYLGLPTTRCTEDNEKSFVAILANHGRDGAKLSNILENRIL